MTSSHWTELLAEPKAILGPYGGSTPALSTFAPHSWRVDFDQVAIAGLFLSLPENVPANWRSSGEARAEAAFVFHEVRLLEVQGLLERGLDDDTLHGKPSGVTGNCSLVETPEPFLKNAHGEVLSYWKRFDFSQEAFSFRVEASDVSIRWGRPALQGCGR
jgi:hypothetical protein